MYLLKNEVKVSKEAAFRRMRLGAALLLTAPGIPMIWMGQEFGEASERTLGPRPLHWELLEQAENRKLFDYYKQLIALRKQNRALQGNTIAIVSMQPEQGIIAFKRWGDDDNEVLVVANLFDAPAEGVRIESPGLSNGCWHDVTHGDRLEIQHNVLALDLGCSEARILVKQ
jgi:1,4-alpha-glucan branching enzyme